MSVAIDIGATKCVIVRDNADLVLTETGGISRASLLCFSDGQRLVGEEAAAQAFDALSVQFDLIGQPLEVVTQSPLYGHRRTRVSASSQSKRPVVAVNYNDVEEIDVAAILAMYLARQDQRIRAVCDQVPLNLAFVCPPDTSADAQRTIREAASIAGIAPERVHLVNKADAMLATYARKLQGLRPVEISSLKDKKVIMVEMGAAQTTAVVLSVSGADAPVPERLTYGHDGQLGALYFDAALFNHFSSEIVVKKHKGEPVVPGSKRGFRLMSGIERLRKLLSQLPEGSVTVENMTDAGDVNLSLKRDELSTLCQATIDKFRALITDTLAKANLAAADIYAVEVLGGGIRMQVVQNVIAQVFGSSMPLGAKFDDASVGLGAALFVNSGGVTTWDSAAATTAIPPLSDEEIASLRAQEESMQRQDAEIAQVQAVRNALEAFLLDMRGAPRRKFGNTIDAAKLGSLLDDVESWLWDNTEASLAVLEEKNSSLRASVGEVCKEYFQKVEEERVELERSLEKDAAAAAAERAAEGTEDDDHDNRKLKFPERMRLSLKNKDEGTELFKGAVTAQQFRTAAARYTKSLTHAQKFFDLTPEQTKEVNALKVTLYLNLARFVRAPSFFLLFLFFFFLPSAAVYSLAPAPTSKHTNQKLLPQAGERRVLP